MLVACVAWLNQPRCTLVALMTSSVMSLGATSGRGVCATSTLLNVAVLISDTLWLLSTMPMYTVSGIVIVFDPIAVQEEPFEEIKPLKVSPCLVSFRYSGAVTAAEAFPVEPHRQPTLRKGLGR